MVPDMERDILSQSSGKIRAFQTSRRVLKTLVREPLNHKRYGKRIYKACILTWRLGHEAYRKVDSCTFSTVATVLLREKH